MYRRMLRIMVNAYRQAVSPDRPSALFSKMIRISTTGSNPSAAGIKKSL